MAITDRPIDRLTQRNAAWNDARSKKTTAKTNYKIWQQLFDQMKLNDADELDGK